MCGRQNAHNHVHSVFQELQSAKDAADISVLSGGCTAVLVVAFEDKIYVANVGNSKAIVVSEIQEGSLVTLQLSTDHNVTNKDELKRLERLGLDPEVLMRSGRLGPHENTRSIGDYNIKGGYKSVLNLK